MYNTLKTIALGVFLTVVAAAGASNAATVLQNGSTVGGWTVTAAPGISLVVDSATSDNVSLEKAAVFSTTTEGLIITFTQASANAASQITFTNEAITNISGTTWSGFQFLLLDDNNSASFVQNADSPFVPPVGYTSVSALANSITYTGSQANMATSMWGFGSDGDLIIDADPLGVGTTFGFKEIPLGGGNVPVPLPTTFWQGLVGIAGLGLVAGARKIKNLFL